MSNENMNTGRLKHLEMIQLIITRMANNSFIIKGWSLTLLAAIISIAVKDKIYELIFIALVSNIIFWWLDAFYLCQERNYRRLWDAKRLEPQNGETDFSMDASVYISVKKPILVTAFSKTLITFHGSMFLILINTFAYFFCKMLT
jgi:hypothetical protein